MHTEVRQFCEKVKGIFPNFFHGTKVLDVGSLDINGNNRYLFKDCDYTGLDLGEGKNVDVVCPVHVYQGHFNVVISTEMLEHDRHWKESLKAMARLSDGLVIITAAGEKRHEHGTDSNFPSDSPFTNDYYQNVTRDMLMTISDQFTIFEITEPRNKKDICFWGIKKNL